MAAALSPNGFRTALVLGGGGPVGIAWMAGLVTGLRAAGVAPARAQRFVGTSAGAVVGAVLAAGGDLTRLRDLPRSTAPRIPADRPRMAEIFAAMTGGGADPVRARQRVGELALAAGAGDPADHVARIAALTGVADWPRPDLVVTSVDAESGDLRAWTRGGAASLAQALAASTAVPGVFPPVPIAGRHYIDGGVRSPINADLAEGAELVVVVEPLAHLFPRAAGGSGPATRISVVPDADAVAAFGADVFDPDALTPAYDAGVRQAAGAAPRLRDVWPAA